MVFKIIGLLVGFAIWSWAGIFTYKLMMLIYVGIKSGRFNAGVFLTVSVGFVLASVVVIVVGKYLLQIPLFW